MFSTLQSAVYKCPLLVEKPHEEPSAIYNSPLYSPQSEMPFFRAWPEIGGDPHQPCCLPALLRARYFINRRALINLEGVAAGAEEYLSHQGFIDPKVKKIALAIIKYHRTLWRYVQDHLDQPPILFGVDRILLTDLNLKIIEPEEITQLFLAQELAIQGLIYGNLKDQKGGRNLFNVVEAFSLAHETGHDLAKVCLCGHALDDLSLHVHAILSSFSIDNFSPEQIAVEWRKFWAINDCIYRLAKKFEPVEEIFANYVALRYLPSEVRRQVKDPLEEDLREKNWDKAYKAFAEVCDNSEEAWLPVAWLITDAVSRMLNVYDNNGIDIDSQGSVANLLHNFVEILKIIWLNGEDIYHTEDQDKLLELVKLAEKKAATQINHILEQANIPKEIYWSVSAQMQEEIIPKHFREGQAILNNNHSHKKDDGVHGKGCMPKITLLGYATGPRKQPYIKSIFLTQCTYYNLEYVHERFFLESLRQQLVYLCGIVCPFSNTKKCCGRRERLKRLYEHIPEEYKKYLSAPDCGSPG